VACKLAVVGGKMSSVGGWNALCKCSAIGGNTDMATFLFANMVHGCLILLSIWLCCVGDMWLHLTSS